MSQAELRGAVLIDLSVAIIRMMDHSPVCRIIQFEDGRPPRLPFGPFFPVAHRTMDAGLRQWVTAQVGVNLGHVEQLYTFGDRGRHAVDTEEEHVVSVGYLALTRQDHTSDPKDWMSIYQFFPWEDWRAGRPEMIDSTIIPALENWLADHQHPEKLDAMRLAFGVDAIWDEELVLERYELLYEAGLVPEAFTDGRVTIDTVMPMAAAGLPLQLDHRRILATAIGRLRGKMKYRPVIFDLMNDLFTLGQLQQTAEAILGAGLHKQNFRRLVERSNLIESTGKISRARGRPAELFRFHYGVTRERPHSGLRISPIFKSRTS